MKKEQIKKIVEKFADLEWGRLKDSRFPYPNIDKEQCVNEWKTLINDEQKSIKSHSSLIKRFHISLFEDKKEKRPSSKEYWKIIQDDFKEFVWLYSNRLTHSNWAKSKENEKYVRIGFIPNSVYLQGMTTSGKAPTPSYFKPMLAKYIINKYLKKYKEIFDPFSGYSGRLLGALACHKNYIGQDISETHVMESRYLVAYLKKFFEIKEKYSIRVRNSLKSKGDYECLFTCSPYSSLESWSADLKDYSCDNWIDKCLKNYKCKRYVFVTDDKIKKYKKFVKEKLVNKSHWGTNYEYIVVIDRK